MLKILNRIDTQAAVNAGLVAGAVYVATMEIDNRITGIDQDDLKLLGRPFVSGPEYAKLVGVPVHLWNSLSLAFAYAVLAHDRLPGPPWVRGVAFTLVENTLLYPLAALEHRHPGIRNGEIDRYFSLNAFLLSIPRHITYGAVVGALYERFRRS